tara:strand:+ start:88 stop:324 length:237 start_codon:yes stop_codon:yes gene_type:complete
MTDMTKKEMEEKIAELEGEKQLIMEQALQLQTVAGTRLMSLRLLESFVNEVNNSFQKLLRDTQELNLQMAEKPEESED